MLVLFLVFSTALLLFGLSRLHDREGFDYSRCRGKGFSRGFCVTTPIGSLGAGACKCADGADGILMHGYGARCVCGEQLYATWEHPLTPSVLSRSPPRYPTQSHGTGSRTTHPDVNKAADADAAATAAGTNRGQGWRVQFDWG